MKSNRIELIDLLRGIVMVIMVLDHVRSHVHYLIDPSDLAVTTPALFFARWITHFCAPVFVFLAGTAAFLYGQKKDHLPELSKFLFSRGIWLVIVEATVVQLAMNINVFEYSVEELANFQIYKALGFQVIWVIGVSMVLLAGLIYLPKTLLTAIGLSMVIFHNLLDHIRFEGLGVTEVLWYFLHQRTAEALTPTFKLLFIYPLIPWVGVMILGYVFGELYRKGKPAAQRKKWLLGMGSGITAGFLVLRLLNFYGDPVSWTSQSSTALTVISFFDLEKYPPSLLFLLMTMGPALLFLAWSEQKQSPLIDKLVIIGRVPLFFYVLHLYCIKLFSEVLEIFQPRYGLLMTYLTTIAVVLALYPLCRRYYRYKLENKDKWWLSYL